MSQITLDDLQTRSRFIVELATSGTAYAVEGPLGFAHVPSPHQAGRDVTLMWSARAEAARWADALVDAPRIAVLALPDLLQHHLPKVAADNRLVGVNWSDRPWEPELEAADLATQIRHQLIANFVEIANRARAVWVLKQGDTPVTFQSATPAGGDVLPVYASRANAERAIASAWSGTQAVRVPLADFLQKAVMWCSETRCRIAPECMPGPGIIEHHAWEVKALLSGHIPVRQVA